MTKNEMMMVWLYVKETWPAFPIPQSTELLAVKEMAWLDQLSDLDAGLVRASIAALGTREFAPNPAQIRERALVQKSIEMGDTQAPDADQAWSEFKANYRTNGPWSHRAVEVTAQAIGCKAYGQSPSDELMAWRAQFVKMYAIVVARLKREASTVAPVLAKRMESIDGPKRIDPMAAIGTP